MAGVRLHLKSPQLSNIQQCRWSRWLQACELPLDANEEGVPREAHVEAGSSMHAMKPARSARRFACCNGHTHTISCAHQQTAPLHGQSQRARKGQEGPRRLPARFQPGTVSACWLSACGMRSRTHCMACMRRKRIPHLAQPGVAQQRLCAWALEGVLGHAGAHEGRKLRATGRPHLWQRHGVLHNLNRPHHMFQSPHTFAHCSTGANELHPATPHAARLLSSKSHCQNWPAYCQPCRLKCAGLY